MMNDRFKRHIALCSGLLLLLSIACRQQKETSKKPTSSDKTQQELTLDITSKFAIEILDDSATAIIDPNATIEVLASGFEWTEGPLYIEGGDYLLFSDIPNNKVYRLNRQGDTLTYLHPSGYSAENFTGAEPGSNGLLLDPEGSLVLMQHGNRQVARMNAPLASPRADYSTVVDRYQGKRFNSPNDGVFDTEGHLYFTDPPYGLPLQMEDPGKELDFQGVYCLLNSGELLLVDTLSRPNGIGLSPDNKYLYVAVSDPNHAVWYRYELKSAGIMAKKQLFHDATHLVGKSNEDGLPDGLKVSRQGIVFATGPGGVWMFNTEGRAIARIRTGQKTANCAFGKDEKKLFMTADDYVLAVDLK